MTPTQAIEYFGSRTAVAEICNISETAVGYWVKQGWIHYDKQCLLEVEARRAPRKGKLRPVASWLDVPEERRPSAFEARVA
jgi:hypothetical protein